MSTPYLKDADKEYNLSPLLPLIPNEKTKQHYKADTHLKRINYTFVFFENLKMKSVQIM